MRLAVGFAVDLRALDLAPKVREQGELDRVDERVAIGEATVKGRGTHADRLRDVVHREAVATASLEQFARGVDDVFIGGLG